MKAKIFIAILFIALTLCVSCKDIYQTKEYDVSMTEVLNAQVVMNNTKFYAGETVRFSILPDPYYELIPPSYELNGKLYTIYSDGNNGFQFVMPSAPIKIIAQVVSIQKVKFAFDAGESLSFVRDGTLRLDISPVVAGDTLEPQWLDVRWSVSDPSITIDDISTLKPVGDGSYYIEATVSASAKTKGQVTAASSDGQVSVTCNIFSLDDIFVHTGYTTGKMIVDLKNTSQMVITDMQIPSFIDRQVVLTVRAGTFNYFQNKPFVRSISLPASLTEIRASSFAPLNGVTYINSYSLDPPLISVNSESELPFSKNRLIGIRIDKNSLANYENKWADYKEYFIGFEDERILLDGGGTIENGTFFVTVDGKKVQGTSVGSLVTVVPQIDNNADGVFQVKDNSLKVYKLDSNNLPQEPPFLVLDKDDPTFQMPDFPVFVTLEFENISRGVTFTEYNSTAKSLVVSTNSSGDRVIQITPSDGFEITASDIKARSENGHIAGSFATVSGGYEYTLTNVDVSLAVSVEITWRGKSFTVTLDKNIETWKPPLAPNTFTVVLDNNMPLNNIIDIKEKAHSTLDGIYYVDKDGFTDFTKKYYSVVNNTLVSGIKWDTPENSTLRAVWKGNKTEVALVDSISGDKIGSVTMEYDSDLPSISIPTRPGYKFLGFYVKQYTQGDANSNYWYYDKDMNPQVLASGEDIPWGYYHKGNGDGTDDAYRMDVYEQKLYARWTSSVWDNQVSSIVEPKKERDAEGEFFAIYDPGEYVYLVKNGNNPSVSGEGLRYKLMADLDFGGYSVDPISSSAGFAAIFDGNRHKISNMRIFSSINGSGLFAKLAPTGVIKNLTLSSDVMVFNQDLNIFGGLVSTVLGGEVSNIVSYASVENSLAYSSSTATGGIIGRVQLASGGTSVKLENLSNYGSVKAKGGNIGGVIGQYNASSPLVLLYNEGEIDSTDNESGNFGGVIGSVEINNSFDIDKIVNVGSFSSRIKTNASKLEMKVGGLIGHFTSNLNSDIVTTIKNFYSTAAFDASSMDAGFYGGVIGSVDIVGANKFIISFERGYSLGKIPASSTNKMRGIIFSSAHLDKFIVDFLNVYISRPNGSSDFAIGGSEHEIPAFVTDFADTSLWSGEQFGNVLPAGFETSVWAIGAGRRPINTGVFSQNTKRPVIKGLGEGKGF
ncbi:MAG: hypothetical protein ACRC4W_08215 [Treponemataceae bacterium]